MCAIRAASLCLKFVSGGVGLSVATIVGIAAFQWGPARAYQRLQNPDWLRTASFVELRRTAHRALPFRFGDPHDAFAFLAQHGDASSVPYLEAALARSAKRPKHRLEPTNAAGGMG